VGDLRNHPWIKVINPAASLGQVRHALFDFDGTISVIRRGWEDIMIPMMIEMICGKHKPSLDIVEEVKDYVDRSTGILTIKQMEWLAVTVERYGLTQLVRTAREYKKQYNERLLQPVRQRIRQIEDSELARDKMMIKGARSFLHALHNKGIKLYLASGTDHKYVLEEAQVLGIDAFFESQIYGALDDTTAYTKKRIIQRIIQSNKLTGEELVVIGDGPVEIQHAKKYGALALGVAVDEYKRNGFSISKMERLRNAQADFIIDGFAHFIELADYLCAGN
jgi:phosphoglycolate phosphatase-like HAD superfamily hydrolase